jgi:1-aminocyclopropane-1-carboxylate deaminase/D-cysteine desulfhydrase-like pyridoxal-dependent ACC family enzyme
MENLSRTLGREIFCKRDDLLGPGLGGNKTRKLEYELGQALAERARHVSTFGGLQSNHARLTAVAARHLGLEPHLFYFAPRPAVLQGNLLLCQLAGARLYFVPFGRGGDGSTTIERTIRLVRVIASACVGAHHFIPVGGHSVRGALGYVRAAIELDEQARALGIQDARVMVAAGTGGTMAGLLAGFALCESRLKVTGIDIGRLWKNFRASIASLTIKTAAALGSSVEFKANEIPLIEDRFVGAAYASMTPEGIDAVRTLARSEGIFLDPVYTGKAFAGMLELLKRGELADDGPIIFLHTGGSPALFANAEAFRE